ncbi:MAG: hypothetical protein ABJL67_06080 [Sulfitobacter sp.]
MFMTTNTGAISRRLEEKVESLELEKAKLIEKLDYKAEPAASIEEKLEPAQALLSNLWKLWETG